MTESEIITVLEEDLEIRYRQFRQYMDPYHAAVAAIVGESVVNQAAHVGGNQWMQHLPAEGQRICRLLGFPIY